MYPMDHQAGPRVGLNHGFACDSLSRAPAHLSGVGRHGVRPGRSGHLQHLLAVARELGTADAADLSQYAESRWPLAGEIGRESWRERVCPSVEVQGVAGS